MQAATLMGAVFQFEMGDFRHFRAPFKLFWQFGVHLFCIFVANTVFAFYK